MKQRDLFPSSEPEIKGQLLALTVLLGNFLEILVKNGCLTKEQAKDICHHSDLRTTYIITDNLKDEMPLAELKRMEQQATRFLASLYEEIDGLPPGSRHS